MKIALNRNVDMIELGNWLKEHVGPIWMITSADMVTPYRPINTPLSQGRQWVVDFNFKTNRLTLELDGRKIKPQTRTALILKFT